MWVCDGLCLIYMHDSHFIFDDVRVNLSDSVNSMGSDDAQVSHVHSLPTLLLNQRHPAQTVHIPREQGCNVLQNHTNA